MDKELELWYNNQFDLFGLDGWKAIIEQAEELKELYSNIQVLNTVEELWLNKGRLDIIDWLLSWESSVNDAHKELSDKDE